MVTCFLKEIYFGWVIFNLVIINTIITKNEYNWLHNLLKINTLNFIILKLFKKNTLLPIFTLKINNRIRRIQLINYKIKIHFYTLLKLIKINRERERERERRGEKRRRRRRRRRRSTHSPFPHKFGNLFSQNYCKKKAVLLLFIYALNHYYWIPK